VAGKDVVTPAGARREATGDCVATWYQPRRGVVRIAIENLGSVDHEYEMRIEECRRAAGNRAARGARLTGRQQPRGRAARRSMESTSCQRG
jgi:hypothetical protein